MGERRMVRPKIYCNKCEKDYKQSECELWTGVFKKDRFGVYEEDV